MIHRQNLVTRKEVAGTLIWYILPERGDKSLGKHRALSPLESSGSLGVGCVYQAIPSEVKHVLLYPVCPTTKKEVRHVGGLSGLQNQHPAHWNVTADTKGCQMYIGPRPRLGMWPAAGTDSRNGMGLCFEN